MLPQSESIFVRLNEKFPPFSGYFVTQKGTKTKKHTEKTLNAFHFLVREFENGANQTEPNQKAIPNGCATKGTHSKHTHTKNHYTI